jgi:uncharacterized protein YbaR (Trm112 family)
VPVHPDLLELIRCPRCRGILALRDVAGGESLTCDACRVGYAVVDDVPQLLPEDARPLDAAGDA